MFKIKILFGLATFFCSIFPTFWKVVLCLRKYLHQTQKLLGSHKPGVAGICPWKWHQGQDDLWQHPHPNCPSSSTCPASWPCCHWLKSNSFLIMLCFYIVYLLMASQKSNQKSKINLYFYWNKLFLCLDQSYFRI